MTEILLDHLEQIMKAPVNYSTVSVQKSLVVAKHILLHGAEKVVQPIRMQLGRHVEQLTQYNTVLLAQQQAGAWLLRLKGGSVDKGGPVREVAVALHNLLQSPQALRYERSVSADPNSLVPVGSKDHVGFATDEVRFQHLKKKMEEQQKIILKSNLKKASDGFGSGYMANDGKAVVGAAHGIEEMLAMQQREEQRFRDEQQQQQAQQQANTTASSFSEYQAPSFSQPPVYNNNLLQTNQQQQQQPQYAQEQEPPAAPEVDLLDFGNEGTAASSAGVTPATTSSQEEDLLFGGDATTTTALPASAETNYMAGSHDPFHVTVAPVQAKAESSSSSAVSGLLGMMSLGTTANKNTASTPSISISSSSAPANGNSSMQPKSVMSTSDDRFAALDALAGGGSGGMAPSSSSSNVGTAAAAAAATATTGTMPLNGAAASGMSMSGGGGTGMSHNVSGVASSANAFSGLGSTTGGSISGAKDAFSGLKGSTFPTPAPAPSLSGLSAAKSQQQQQQQQNSKSNAFAMPVQQQPPPAFATPPDLSSIRVSDMGFASPPDSNPNLDDSESGFVMGGSSGTGLAPAPAVPPPPPPGGW